MSANVSALVGFAPSRMNLADGGWTDRRMGEGIDRSGQALEDVVMPPGVATLGQA